jgi:hypothetical protein
MLISVHELRKHIQECDNENFMYVYSNVNSDINAIDNMGQPHMLISVHSGHESGNINSDINAIDNMGQPNTHTSLHSGHESRNQISFQTMVQQEMPNRLTHSGQESSGNEMLVSFHTIVQQDLSDISRHNVHQSSNINQVGNNISEQVQPGQNLKDIVENCIKNCKTNDISNPVEILRKIQEQIVTGRPLELEDANSSIEGETNSIYIDRDRVMETGMEEISSNPQSKLRNTLELQFYN